MFEHYEEKALDRIADRLLQRLIPRIERGHGEKPCLKRLLTADEAGEVLSCSRGAIYHMAARGRIPAIRRGRSLRFDIDDLVRPAKGGRS
jgi:excisionase family DNA binding protein